MNLKNFFHVSLYAVFLTLTALADAVELIDVKYTSFQPSLRELVTKDYKKKPVNLTAKLRLPDGAGPFPAIVWVHGLGGQEPYEKWGWMARLNRFASERGIAVLVIDSYTERGISPKDTVSGKVTLNMAARLMDTYAATSALTKDKRINSDKVFVMGHSFGGLVSIASASTTINNSLKDFGVVFAGHIPISPECLTRPQNLSYDNKPMWIISGEKDDLTPSKHCVDLVKAMKPAENVKLHLISDGTHNLMDASTSQPQVIEIYTYDACGRWEFDEVGGYTLPDMGGVNNGSGISEFNRVVASCAKNSRLRELSSSTINKQVETIVLEYLDRFVK